MSDAVRILKSQGACLIADDGCRNCEDDDPMACIVLDISQCDKIIVEIERLQSEIEGLRLKLRGETYAQS
jgi:hypothetical protein